MILFSAHQTYLNNKLLKKRLSTTPSGFDNTGNCSSLLVENNLFKEYNRHQHQSYIINLRQLTTTTSNQINLDLMQQTSKQSRLMQRTRKYFSSDGHKFLFNNT